jgi:hypothetical protein
VADVIVIDADHDAERVAGGYAAWEAARRRTGSTASASAITRMRQHGSTTTKPADREGTKGATTSTTGPVEAPADGAGRSASARQPRSASTLHHLTRELEKKMRKLEKQRERVAAEVADIAGTDHHRLATVGRDLAAVEAQITVTEDEWLALADEAERSTPRI